MQISGIASVAPASFEEMYRQYHDYVLTIVQKLGIDPGNVEDVASIIMIKAFEKDVIGRYDGEVISKHTGRPVVFKSFLYSFVATYVQHHRDRQQITKRRDGYYIGTTDEETSWLADRGELHYETYDDLFAGELIRRIRAVCAALPARAGDRLDMSTFFDFVLIQIEDEGKVSMKDLADLFEVNVSTIYSRLRKLRAIVAELTADA